MGLLNGEKHDHGGHLALVVYLGRDEDTRLNRLDIDAVGTTIPSFAVLRQPAAQPAVDWESPVISGHGVAISRYFPVPLPSAPRISSA
mgnify:CR=1 FL=1